MKTFLSILFALIFCYPVYSQKPVDVVHLKNGNVIRGAITEQTPPTLKIETPDGNIFVYRYDEIEKIMREDGQPPANESSRPEGFNADESGTIGVGIAAGGGGLAGIPLRFSLSRRLVAEAGVFVIPAVIKAEKYYLNPEGEYSNSGTTKTQLRMSPLIAGGLDYFIGESFHPKSGKLVKNGMMLRAGTTVGAKYNVPVQSFNPSAEYTIDSSFSQTMLVIGWARERYKTTGKKSVYILELGIGFLKFSGINSHLGTLLDDDISAEPFIYWKFHWNFFLNRKQ